MRELSPNLTDAHLDAITSALPDDMNEAELCALTLTIHAAYLDDTAEIMSSLISAIYTFGAANGLSREKISIGLRMAADLHDTNPETKH